MYFLFIGNSIDEDRTGGRRTAQHEAQDRKQSSMADRYFEKRSVGHHLRCYSLQFPWWRISVQSHR